MRVPCSLAQYDSSSPCRSLCWMHTSQQVGRTYSLHTWQLKQGSFSEGLPGSPGPIPTVRQLCLQQWGPSFLLPTSPLPSTHPHPNPARDLVSVWGLNPIALQETLRGWDFNKPLNPSIVDWVVTQGPARQLIKVGTTPLCPWGYSMALRNQWTEVTKMEEKNLET